MLYLLTLIDQLLSSQLTELSDLERVRRSATNEDKNDESDDESDEKFGEKNDTNCRPHRRGGQHHWKVRKNPIIIK